MFVSDTVGPKLKLGFDACLSLANKASPVCKEYWDVEADLSRCFMQEAEESNVFGCFAFDPNARSFLSPSLEYLALFESFSQFKSNLSCERLFRVRFGPNVSPPA